MKKRLPASIRCRYVFAFAAAAAMAIINGLNSHFFITVIYMGNHTVVNSTFDNAVSKQDGPLLYPVTKRNVLISLYFGGYLLTQVLGGRFAEALSGKWTVFTSVVLTIACTLFIPYLVRMHVCTIFVLRFLQGLAGGVSVPALHAMIARWAPPHERSAISSIIYSSECLGIAVSFVISYYISTALNWKYVFYIIGSSSTPWLILWIVFITDHPHDHPCISDEEKGYLELVINTVRTPWRVPLKSILKTKPFWAIFTVHVCGHFTWYTLLLNLPLYITQVFGFKLRDAFFFTALAFFCAFLFGIAYGIMRDVFIVKGTTSLAQSRSLGTYTAIFPPALCLIFLALEGIKSAGAIALTTIATGFMGSMFSGYYINHIDIAPNYAGTLMGLTNTFATIPAILFAIFVEKLINYRPTLNSWHLIFALDICLLLIGAMIYSVFESSVQQEWNAIIPKENEEN